MSSAKTIRDNTPAKDEVSNIWKDYGKTSLQIDVN